MKENIIRIAVCVVAAVIIGTTVGILTGNSDLAIMTTTLSALILSIDSRRTS